MDHSYINEFDIVDHYLMGKLAAEERAQFEEHFVDCPDCIERLKITKGFIQGMRLSATEQALKTDSPAPLKPSGYFSHIFSRRPLAWAASLLLAIAVIGAVLSAREMRRLQSDAYQAHDASAEWERRYEEERQNASLSEKEFQDKEQALTEKLRELEAELQNKKDQPSGQSSQWTQPAINIPILVLNSIQRTGQNSSDKNNQVTLPRSPSDFMISVSLEGEAEYKDYEVAIFDNAKRLVWKSKGGRPDRYNTLSIGLNSILLRSGNYLLTVEGVGGEGGSKKVGDYPFRIIKNS